MEAYTYTHEHTHCQVMYFLVIRGTQKLITSVQFKNKRKLWTGTHTKFSTGVVAATFNACRLFKLCTIPTVIQITQSVFRRQVKALLNMCRWIERLWHSISSGGNGRRLSSDGVTSLKRALSRPLVFLLVSRLLLLRTPRRRYNTLALTSGASTLSGAGSLLFTWSHEGPHWKRVLEMSLDESILLCTSLITLQEAWKSAADGMPFGLKVLVRTVFCWVCCCVVALSTCTTSFQLH